MGVVKIDVSKKKKAKKKPTKPKTAWQRAKPHLQAIGIIFLIGGMVFGTYVFARVIIPRSIVHLKTNPNFLSFTNTTWQSSGNSSLFWTSVTAISTKRNPIEVAFLSSMFNENDTSLMLFLTSSYINPQLTLAPDYLLGLQELEFAMPRGENLIAFLLTYYYKFNDTEPVINGVIVYPIATTIDNKFLPLPQNEIGIWSKDYMLWFIEFTDYNATLDQLTITTPKIGQFGADYFDFMDLFVPV